MKHFFEHKILPAITIEDETKAVKIAEAVIAGGLNIMEVPFRTEAAARCIRKIVDAFPNLHVGAGTLLTPEQVVLAKESGSAFGLAPGFNKAVVQQAIDLNFPFIPGVMTPSEVELALEMECKVQKLFPASQVGGINMLKALAGPYGHTGVAFIPMGGVSLKNMDEFLAMQNVIAIGGSWLATKQLIADGDYSTITKNISKAIGVAVH
ncbi:bifunctional 4-hydroxy-2-oxoglutarate aldolase/2-dehydro-3-deoxy-phosphogluconate aldolase [Flavivirga amylovorans]|uniref:Bifunctional 4-hydroxy-2-oxoglutarate aldolase/2-dehydro-3-deoxy-phosphogluconate aldolase n=1 Tax=Flavivirga amylovorans TaxID=870486 RepID=A0ABT8WYY3_9FLAO|nr:bifunctional 4-hydroxy-2-oxoglutarate aldolase/2-dehydro-3-deoxy-phosphogluconate aldolase [Flavivirga amylovorans]MDO5986560.1 bifunctional 4-hydroxy-2-oxoglutarate aldolase/2-dehydro-3-deoxy-phosphogluconate aldolase [Flavivirga amylovorans]